MALFLNNCVIIKVIYEPFWGRDGKMKKATFIVIIVLSIFTTCLFGATKDTTPPTVSITNPKDNAVVSGVVTIQVNASDSGGIAKVEFYVGDSKLGEDSSKPYEYSWDTKKMKDGTYVLTVKATDGAGNKNSKSIKVVVKNPKVETWQKTFGGKGSDEAKSIQQTTDGGYIVAGSTDSFGSERKDVYILKLDAKGEVEWQKTLGGKDFDGANSIQQAKDGGFIVAGWTDSFGSGEKDVYILKLNSKGEIEWQKTFGGKGDDVANSIQQTTDGGYIVAGWTNSFGFGWQDVYILKLNSKGEVQWQKTFGEKYVNDEANSIQQTADGGYIIAGWTASFGSGWQDVYILKLNAKGEVEWQKTFFGKDFDGTNSIQQTADGGYIVVGWTSSFGSGGEDFYILKLNARGDLEWQKTFGGEYDDEANSIQQTADGGYIVAGRTNSFGSGEADVYILKLNSKGELERQKTFGGEGYDEAKSIQQTTDGGYIVAGRTNSFGSGLEDIYILKLNANGEIDTTPPEVEIISPSNGVELGGTIDINIDAKDNYYLEKVMLYIDGKKVKEYTSGPYKYSWDSNKAGEGTHTIAVEAVDNSGNAITKIVTVVMDNIKDVSWQKTFGGEGSDEANSVQQTTDGGYIVAGWTNSFGSGGYDFYILKLNSKGQLEWQKTFGGEGSDEANSVQQTADGGYIVAGWTNSFGAGKEDVYILKLNAKGEVEWQKTFGGKYDDKANSIQQTTDGGYIVAGWTASLGSGGQDVYILKLNAKGEVEWQKTFGGKDDDGANSIQQTADGGYIVSGWTKSFGSGEEDVFISKLSPKGQLEWQKAFGGEDDDEANSIQQTTDGGYIVAGETYSFDPLGDAYILKLSAKGEFEWQKTFGGRSRDEANSIQQTADVGYIVAGRTWSFGSEGYDVYILKLNSKGELEWEKTFGGENDDEANSIQQAMDGGYIVAGWTESFGSEGEDVYVLKLDAKGQLGWQKTFGGKYDDEANSFQKTADGGYIVAGWTKSFGSGEKDVYTLKLNAKGEIEWQKTFGGKDDDEAELIQQTADGGYIVVGWTASLGSGGEDVYILKLNSKGEAEWQKTFGGESDDEANSFQKTADGGYIVAGWTKSFGSGGEDVYILKLNSKGEVEWQKTFGGKNNDGANSIQLTADGGYIVAGWTSSFGSGEADVYILKLDVKGQLEWQKMFGGEYIDEAKSIRQTTDGGYIVVGSTESFDSGVQDIYILKLDAKGQLEWQKTFGGEYSDRGNSIQQTADGGYIVAGWTNSFGFGLKDVYILKFNAKGDLEWEKTFGGENYDEANAIQQTKDGGYIVAGWTKSFGSGLEDVYILKLNSKGEVEE